MQNRLIPSHTVIFKYGAWLAFGIFLYFYLHLFKNALGDDAFITLRYVKTLRTSGTWGFFPGQIANSATSPLNVLLLTLVSVFTGSIVEAALWLYFACLLCVVLVLVRLSLQVTGSEIYGWLAASALTFNPFLVSTMGLESIVFTALFVCALYCYQTQKWIALAIALGLLTLTRAEGGLFFLVFLLFVPDTRTKLRVLAAYCLCIAPWYLFSWIYLGSFFPDTLFIKMEQVWGGDFFNGITSMYYQAYPLRTVLSFAFLPLATVLINKQIREIAIFAIIALAGFVHFLGYSFLSVPPLPWYYVPDIIAIILLGSLGLGKAFRSNNTLWLRSALGLVTAIYFLVPALGMSNILIQENFIINEMPIHSNWATHEQYKEIGLWLKDNYGAEAILLDKSEIGTIVYYCDCRLIDWFSDRTWLKDYIANHSGHSRVMSTLLRINFAFYSEPETPSYVYNLKSYSTGPSADVEVIKEWRISTKRFGPFRVVFSRQH